MDIKKGGEGKTCIALIWFEGGMGKMERLTSYKNECKREMICRHEECFMDEEHCPHVNEDICSCLQEVLEKLAEYEDLEEQGKLLKLPCAVGDMVYRINKGARAKLIVMRVRSIKIFLVGKILSVKIECVEDIYGGEYICLAEKIGKTIFLTREAAEAALMEG